MSLDIWFREPGDVDADARFDAHMRASEAGNTRPATPRVQSFLDHLRRVLPSSADWAAPPDVDGDSVLLSFRLGFGSTAVVLGIGVIEHGLEAVERACDRVHLPPPPGDAARLLSADGVHPSRPATLPFAALVALLRVPGVVGDRAGLVLGLHAGPELRAQVDALVDVAATSGAHGAFCALQYLFHGADSRRQDVDAELVRDLLERSPRGPAVVDDLLRLLHTTRRRIAPSPALAPFLAAILRGEHRSPARDDARDALDELAGKKTEGPDGVDTALDIAAAAAAQGLDLAPCVPPLWALGRAGDDAAMGLFARLALDTAGDTLDRALASARGRARDRLAKALEAALDEALAEAVRAGDPARRKALLLRRAPLRGR